jgi:hypothetical protein
VVLPAGAGRPRRDVTSDRARWRGSRSVVCQAGARTLASVPGRCVRPVSPDTGHGCAGRSPGRRWRQVRHGAVRTLLAPGQPRGGKVWTRPGRGVGAGNDIASAGRALLHAPERSRSQAAHQQEEGSQAMSDHGGMSDGRTGRASWRATDPLDTAFHGREVDIVADNRKGCDPTREPLFCFQPPRAVPAHAGPAGGRGRSSTRLDTMRP